MTRPVGPTIPRWQLGENLRKLRLEAGLSQADVKHHLGCSISKVQNMERGSVGVVKAEVESLLSLYGITDQQECERFLELQRLGKSRGWWSRFGKLPSTVSNFLGIESAATQIQEFEPQVISGLLQTEDYARSVEASLTPTQPHHDCERNVQLRLERQQHVLHESGDTRPDKWFVFDEAVFHRLVGGPKTMVAQIDQLVELVNARMIVLQIVPFSCGGYPGTLGSFSIYSFDESLHSPVAFVESQAGNLYMEHAEDIERCKNAYAHISSIALSPEDSLKRLKSFRTALTR